MALVGGFSQDPNYEEDAKIADKFFTNCEPPHHDQWTDTTELLNRFIQKNKVKSI